MSGNKLPFNKLREIVATLRAPGGCAWDRKQTHKSLLPYLIEETYEVVEAIEKRLPAKGGVSLNTLSPDSGCGCGSGGCDPNKCDC